MNIDSFDDYFDSNEHFLYSNAKITVNAHFDLSDADSRGSIDIGTSSKSDDDSDMSDGSIADSHPVSLQEKSVSHIILQSRYNYLFWSLVLINSNT